MRSLRRVPATALESGAPDADADLQLRWLGVAGFVLEAAQHTIVIDPYLSRPGLLQTGLQRLRVNEALLAAELPRANDVLVGHAHYDHILDAPALCLRTGARLIGSPAVGQVGRAAGLPEAQIRVTHGREEIESGPGRLRGLPSRHGRVYFGRVPLPGDITAPPPWPPRFTDLRHGLVLNWWVELGGLRVVHIDSAEFLNEELAAVQADVLCLCAIGYRSRPNYVADALRILRPRLVIPCHWDWFFSPFGAPPRVLPGLDLGAFCAEIRAHGVEARLLPVNGRLGLRAP
jgi:L-ascorbate metabolism protein UlaG (beta-lactamase superfamily)